MKKIDVAIIDYKMSNLFSVQSACNFVGLSSIITSDKDKILNSKSAILPGVGSFSKAMQNFNKLNLTNAIQEFINTGRPFLGICLGMQLLFTESEEFGVTKGLNIISGKIKKFPLQNSEREKIKIPHIGWNQIDKSKIKPKTNWNTQPLQDIKNKEQMYFVHSFYVEPDNENLISTKTTYKKIDFCSSITHNNIFACQFHPEKSACKGLKIYKNFAKTIKQKILINQSHLY